MLKKFLLIGFLTLSITSAMAQGNPPPIGGGGSGGSGTEPGGPLDPGSGNEPPPEGAVPVDGGLALLLAAGAGYGAKKAYDYKNNKVKSEK